MKKIFFSIFFLTFFLPIAASAEPELFQNDSMPGWDYDQTEFRHELGISARKVVELARTRFSQIRSINDSYLLTAKAALLLADRGDTRAAIPLLQEAAKKFDGNRLAYLLLGA